MGAAGTRERIIKAMRYNPSHNWDRKRKKDGSMAKKVGDLIITERETIEVTRKGHEYRRAR
jgi:hypothetical protein